MTQSAESVVLVSVAAQLPVEVAISMTRQKYFRRKLEMKCLKSTHVYR